MHQQVSVTIFGKCTFDVERYVQRIISYADSLMLFKFYLLQDELFPKFDFEIIVLV